MMEKIKKQISGILIIALVLVTTLPSQQALASTNKKDANKAVGLNMVQSDKLTKFEPYVNIKNNKYVLEIPSNIKKSINKDDLVFANKHVKDLNNLLVENNIKDVSIENGFTIIIDESKIDGISNDISINNGISKLNNSITMSSKSAYKGVTKIEIHWNYAKVFLSSSAVKSIMVGGAAVAGSYFKNVVIGTKIVLTVFGKNVFTFIGGVIGYKVATYNPRPISFNYNYVNHIEVLSLRYQ